MSAVKKSKLRKPRKLWDIAECCAENGYRYIKFTPTIYKMWFSISDFRDLDKVAKWFADAAAWLKEQETK